jgi:hypothetical protein
VGGQALDKGLFKSFKLDQMDGFDRIIRSSLLD